MTNHFRSDSPLSFDSFKRNLKTHYFTNNWPPGDASNASDSTLSTCALYKLLWMNEWTATAVLLCIRRLCTFEVIMFCFHYVSLFRTPSVCPVPMDSSARRASPLHICIGRGIIWSPSLNGKGEGLDTCYGATYMSQTRDQQRFTISEVAADWHTIAPISHTSLHPLAGATTYFPSRWGTWVGLSTG